MKFKRNSNQTAKIVFLLLILAIGIGYAYLTSNLSITGATNVAGNTWNIHFANVQIATGSVTATTPATINPSDNTKINYAVLLNKPGDFYEFTVDMVNSGTLPGKVTLVELNGITSSLGDVIDYSIVYTNNNNPVAVDDILNAESSKNIKVRVYYKEDIEEDDLLNSDVNLTLTFDVTFNQSDEEEVTTETIIQQLKTENSSCFTKYEGQVTDQVGQTVTAQNVYFNKCADKRNVIFGGYCWQMIRTTETGGLKMIYNGEPEDGKCENTRGNHKGIAGQDASEQALNSEYLYGDSFEYDISNNEYHLIDTEAATWSDSTYQNLLGKFTCKNMSGTCTTMYNVNSFISEVKAKTTAYKIGDTNYAQIGTSSFNPNSKSIAMTGYKFNKVYDYITTYDSNSAPDYGTLKGNDVSYSNGEYTLLPAVGESELSTLLDATNHYTCNNTTGSCTKVRYYYYLYYYIELEGGKKVQDVLNEMLYADDVNKYNSSMKGVIDSWYAQNLIGLTNMLEDSVFCNDRNITSLAGWNPNGGNYSSRAQFKGYNMMSSLVCQNDTDQFSIANPKAKLTYPIALLSSEELVSMNEVELLETGKTWLSLTPISYTPGHIMRSVSTDGTIQPTGVSGVPASGVRPVVSLKSYARISSGTGSTTDPWIVE